MAVYKMHEYIASSNASMFLLRVGFLSSGAGPDARDTITNHDRPDCAGTWALHFRCQLPVPRPVSNGSTASTLFFFPLYVPLVCKVQRKRNAYTLQEFLMSSLYFQLISSVLADP